MRLQKLVTRVSSNRISAMTRKYLMLIVGKLSSLLVVDVPEYVIFDVTQQCIRRFEK